ncbi:hypothetical protein ACFOU2_23150 [Bacillus songklensis]|uniref:Uncharacterized protein n=1 Tax=Bacillus songklensis TaxID=1069116 RepID=A0ABV8BAR3_9BACI
MPVSREFIEELKRNGVKAEVCPPRSSFSFYHVHDRVDGTDESIKGRERNEPKEYNY